MHLPTSDRGPLGMLSHVCLANFEAIGKGFGPWKIPKSLEKGPFWKQKWLTNASKGLFSTSDPGALGVHKQVF